MTKVPFQHEIEDLFASDKSVALKRLGGAFVGGLVALRVVLKDPKAGGPVLSTPVKVGIVVATAVSGMLAVFLLSLRTIPTLTPALCSDAPHGPRPAAF